MSNFWRKIEELKQLKKERKKAMYSYTKTFTKGLKMFVLFALPWLISLFIKEMPEIANISIGGLLVMMSNYLKHKIGTDLGGLL